MDRGRVSVLVYYGKPETSVQVRKGQLPRISEATSIGGYELRSFRMDVVVHGRMVNIITRMRLDFSQTFTLIFMRISSCTRLF